MKLTMRLVGEMKLLAVFTWMGPRREVDVS
jgi:hypothetical protein